MSNFFVCLSRMVIFTYFDVTLLGIFTFHLFLEGDGISCGQNKVLLSGNVALQSVLFVATFYVVRLLLSEVHYTEFLASFFF
jgi:hypothetical protein